MAQTLKEGLRVRFTAPFDVYPFVLLEGGETGVIHSIDADQVWVVMDKPFTSYDEATWYGSGWPDLGVSVRTIDLEYDPNLLEEYDEYFYD